MKLFIALVVLVAVASALPSPQDSAAYTIANENDNIGVGNYQAKYATSNGISADETGELKQGGTEGQFLTKRGSYSYTLDGVTYTINYTADENGFVAEGAHIPKALV